MEEAKTMKTPMSSSIKLDMDEKASFPSFYLMMASKREMTTLRLKASALLSISACLDRVPRKARTDGMAASSDDFLGRFPNLVMSPRLGPLCGFELREVIKRMCSLAEA
ncbi:hypothetical protein CK203_018865 [Vitis vinifera]|uniref:Uncharacterized protein n=1 Tax=Vitis vinifera TaxID=29760 RepID=A0A438IQV4_VITVI|nr:hypothetical protein CK203_018865 [Vitis vinifera]